MLAGDLAYAQADRINHVLESGATVSKGVHRGLSKEALAAHAVALVAQAARRDPLSGPTALTRAKDLAILRDFAGAKKAALGANRLLASAETFAQLGYIHMELGDLDDADRFFVEALAIDPSDMGALERRVAIRKLQLTRTVGTGRQERLKDMLGRMRELQEHALFDPNETYFWSQYWHERAITSRRPLHFAAGYRAAGLATILPNPRRRRLLFRTDEMFKVMNYFLMGARGLPVVVGREFPAKLPVNLSHIQLHD